jgi:hypothetical protein
MITDVFSTLSVPAPFSSMKKWLEKTARLSPQDSSTVLLIILVVALLVILLRLLAPFEVGYDQCIQLESAHRLARGLGLTSTYFLRSIGADLMARGLGPTSTYFLRSISYDLNVEPEALYLTWFAPAFSLLIGGLLALGLPAVIALKLTYSLVTLAGWTGWGLIAASMLTKPIRLFTKLIPFQYAIAAILPIFFTPDWKGTDIYLWAGTPWIVLLLGQALTSANLRYVVGAGLISGLLYSFRYASLFLALSVFLILAIAHLPRLKPLVVQFAWFLGGSLVFILPVSIYNRVVMGGAGLPPYISSYGFAYFSSTIERIGHQLPTASILFGLPVSEIVTALPPQTPWRYLYGVAVLLILAFLPYWVKRLERGHSKDFGILLGLTCLPISLVLFLVVCMFTNPFGFLETERYYVGVNLCFILAFYRLSSLPEANWSVRWIASIFVTVLLVHYGLYRPSDLWNGKQAQLIEQVAGYTPTSDVSYPSNQFYTPMVSQSLRSTVKKLQQEYPDAIFFAVAHPFYIYDGSTGVRLIHGDWFWQRAYVTRPTKVFWVTASYQCTEICGTVTNKNIDVISKLPQLKTVFVDPENKGKILTADLPAGFKFNSYSTNSQEPAK